MDINPDAKPDDARPIRCELSADERTRLRAHAKRLKYGSMNKLARRIILEALDRMDREESNGHIK